MSSESVDPFVFSGDSRLTIESSIPHRPPFLFVDKILRWSEEEITCSYRFKEDEFFFKGHYPGSPLVPGVILCESAMQAGAVFLSKKMVDQGEEGEEVEKLPVVGRIDKVKFRKTVLPGDEIEMNVKVNTKMSNVWYLSAKITSQGATVLTFEFAVTGIPK